ncbi:MAG: nicotinate-nucleotide--dimethylbenzimidazole phosphoribosyltransferase [Hydrogenophilales bacterium]|nr:nicotinate-nucleotide--dimethylbenzimidazole phosphoribosyltransferase [Hydrogenophilales bacterium]
MNAPDPDFEQQARARQAQLTKPPGALGRLEDIACWFAARQKCVVPKTLVPAITVFAGDHGVTEEGVSAFPSVVTGEMVKNFARGGAAINVLARHIGARLTVVDAGVSSDVSAVQGIVHCNLRRGTANLVQTPAMTRNEAERAVALGRVQARADIAHGANLLIAGEMGIGNTTPSACLICAFTGAAAEAVVGNGTGVDDAGRARKIEAVRRGLARAGSFTDGINTLAEVGGLEIAAMTGYYLEAAEAGVPALLDGFISTAAALAARAIEPRVTDWLLASHLSFENGHRIALENLALAPLVDLQMRLGEGSGAAVIVPLLQAALKLHAEMATFAEAGVSAA